MPQTTFIVPSCGRDTLQRAINSAKKQAPVLFQIDDKKEGASAIRNLLIQKAQTEWVSMLDDDDTVTDDYVQRLNEAVEKNPKADLVVFREIFLQQHMKNKYPDHFIWTAPVVHWGQIGIAFSVKRELAIKYPFIEEPNEDFHFVSRIDQAGYNVVFSPYIVYRARH